MICTFTWSMSIKVGPQIWQWLVPFEVDFNSGIWLDPSKVHKVEPQLCQWLFPFWSGRHLPQRLSSCWRLWVELINLFTVTSHFEYLGLYSWTQIPGALEIWKVKWTNRKGILIPLLPKRRKNKAGDHRLLSKKLGLCSKEQREALPGRVVKM